MSLAGKILGYARVSSKEQHLDRQIAELEKYVAHENILVDKASGKDLDRPSYQALKGALGLRKGDTLYVTSLDRLSRSKRDIKAELEWFKANQVTLRILDLPTSMIEVPKGQEWIMEMISNILIEVLASMAEQERLTIRKRQAEGIAAAKTKGKYLGRPKLVTPTNFEEVYIRWKAKEITAVKATSVLGVSRSSFYKLVKLQETAPEKC
ncbi:MAG: recombinase family protein [Lachnospiraceae bacterium]|nr:recombinase family protein [Lachnospiraceae bacterium]